MKPKQRYIHPDDNKKELTITFNLSELKTLQGIVLDTIERTSKEEDVIYQPHTELAKKLEYFITEYEA